MEQYSQAVLSFMYEAGLLIVSGEDNTVKMVVGCPVAGCEEAKAYGEPDESAVVVPPLGRLQYAGTTECDRDERRRRIYRLSLKSRARAKSLCFRQRP